MTYLELDSGSGLSAFLLVYFTLFLDNVLLTVLVPIIPDWVRGEALALWRQQGAPLASLLNRTVAASEAGSGGAQAAVGIVLGARSAAQLAAAPAAAVLTLRLGPARSLRLATLSLAVAALVFAWCGKLSDSGGVGCAVCAGVGRGIQGCGGALGGVAGMALVSRALRPARRHSALSALLGAVALGVLVGYPFGGAAYKLWSPAAPFQLIALTLFTNLGLQYMFLNKTEYNERPDDEEERSMAWSSSLREMWCECRGVGGAGAGAGAVFVSTGVMAALEPCLPLWIEHKFHPQRWALGAVFVPDSIGYLVSTSVVPACGSGTSVAVWGLASVGFGAISAAIAQSLVAVAGCEAVAGAGVGAVDAALVPALLAHSTPARLPHRAALLQSAASAAFAIGPVLGGLASWCVGFETCLRALGVINLLYAAALYRHLRKYPLSEQWAHSGDDEDSMGSELTPLGPIIKGTSKSSTLH
ncbi:unnamed protein product [Leptosia nina]|uniref:Uncharacterized protein n=1 Tax=Leptosia nina TaxID=320188 RepID=A0AAV1JF31_9NEOP